MSRTQFEGFTSDYVVAEVVVAGNMVKGEGRLPFSVLCFHVELHLGQIPGTRLRDQSILYTGLTGDVHFHSGTLALRLGAIESLQINSYGRDDYSTRYPILLRIPVSAWQLDEIEKLRMDSVKFELNLNLGVHPNCSDESGTANVTFSRACALQARLEVDVTRDQWLKNVLAPLGYNAVRVIEIPYDPSIESPLFKSSVSALDEAERFFRLGEYQDVFARCRVALDPHFVQDANGPDKRTKIIDTKWKFTLGEATYSWLNTVLSDVRRATHESHHKTELLYSRLDAQMILTVTALLLSFLSRHSMIDGD